MKKLLFATGNSQKFHKGQHICQEYGIELLQAAADIDEVQSEDPKYVALKKAKAAFDILKQPVIISDDSWEIHGLRGFPGTYAKSVNTWFTADDYIRLTRDLDDRKITFRQILVYQNAERQQYFAKETPGKLLKEARGTAGVSLQKVVSLEPDGVRSISEMIGDSTHYTGTETLQVWHELAKWLTKERP